MIPPPPSFLCNDTWEPTTLDVTLQNQDRRRWLRKLRVAIGVRVAFASATLKTRCWYRYVHLRRFLHRTALQLPLPHVMLRTSPPKLDWKAKGYPQESDSTFKFSVLKWVG